MTLKTYVKSKINWDIFSSAVLFQAVYDIQNMILSLWKTIPELNPFREDFKNSLKLIWFQTGPWNVFDCKFTIFIVKVVQKQPWNTFYRALSPCFGVIRVNKAKFENHCLRTESFRLERSLYVQNKLNFKLHCGDKIW